MGKKSIVKNYIYNLIYQILSIVLPLITTPYLSRVLGAEALGIYGYTYSIVTYFVLFGSLGVAMYGQREIAYVQNDKKQQSKTFWEIVLFRLITMTITLLVFYFIFCINGNYKLYYRILLLELIANALDISWYFQGIEDFGKTVIRNIIVKLISLICIFVFVKSPNDLWKYFLIYSCSNVLGNLTMWMYIPKLLTKIKVKELNIKEHIKPTISLFIPQVATQIYTVLDKTMIGGITGNMTDVGFYEQAQKIVKTLVLVVTALGTVMSSRIANTFASQKNDEIKNYLKKSFNIVWFLAMPMMFGIIAIAPTMVPWFYGEGFDEVVPLLIATSPIILAIGLSNVTGIQYLIPTGKQNKFTISVTVGAIINVIFNFVLINVIGTIGAVISSVISEFVILIIQLYYSREIVKIRYFFSGALRYLIAGIIMGITVYYISLKMSIGVISTIMQIIIGTLIYFIILFALKDELIYNVMSELKQRVLNILHK